MGADEQSPRSDTATATDVADTQKDPVIGGCQQTVEALLEFSAAPLPFAATADAVTVGAAAHPGSSEPLPRTMRSRDRYGAIAAEAAGRYSLESPLGEGGFGRVDAVFDAQLERSVAMKLLLPPEGIADELTASAMLRGREARFINEARITGKLEHPGIVPIYELGRRGPDGELYYVMRLIKGHDFEATLRGKAFDERLKRLPRFVDASNAVAYAHSRGVIHRDLKPENIMLGDYGETLVVDWGLAKVKGEEDLQESAFADGIERLRHESNVRTIAGQALGTPSYMPPEQCVGELDAIDERSDVYALGAVLYHLLTGKPPYGGDTLHDILQATIQGDLVAPRELEPSCPVELDAIVTRALRMDKNDRYANAGALAKDVQAFLDGGLVRAHDYSASQRLIRWLRMHRLRLFAVAALVLGAGGAWFSTDRAARTRAERAETARLEVAQAEERARRDELLAELGRIIEDTAGGSSTPRWLDTYAFKIVSLGEPIAAAAIEDRLVAALEHPSRDVRRLAARSLSGLHRSHAVEALTARLAEEAETDEDVLIEIVNALGVIGDPRADAAVAAARWRSGQYGHFWEQTKLAYSMIPLPILENGRDVLSGDEWNKRGKSLVHKGRRDEAVEAYSKAIAAAPKDHRSYNNRAIEQARRERFDAALDDYTKAIELDPAGGMVTRFNRAALKRKVDDFAGAIRDYDALIELEFRLPTVLRGRAVAYRYLGQYDLAITDLERALETKARDPRSHLALAIVRVDMKQWNHAVDQANRALALNPDFVAALVTRSVAHRMLGEVEAATGDLDRAVDLDPSSDSARVSRAALRLHLGDVDGASEDMNHCLDNPCRNKVENQATRLFYRGVILHAQRERWEDAHRDVERAYTLASKRSEQVQFAIAGMVLARRLPGGEHAGTWRLRLKPRPKAYFYERVLRVIAGDEPYEDLLEQTRAQNRLCLVYLAGGLERELAGDANAALERYSLYETVERPKDPDCLMASAAARLADE
jgi:tetratricopeptide (TPR) repeat protein